MALVNLGQPFPSSPSGWLNELEGLKAAGLFLDATVACYDGSFGHTQRDQNPFRAHLCVLAAAGNEFLRSVLMEHHQQNQVRLNLLFASRAFRRCPCWEDYFLVHI